MISVLDTTPPKGSYKRILDTPLSKKIFVETISQLGIQESIKESIVAEFDKTLNDFRDPLYTGDLEDFKVNLYTTLDEADKSISLVDVLSTEEFIAKTTKAVEKNISIRLTEANQDVSLEEYLRVFKKSGKDQHILPVLRGLYTIYQHGVRRDTSELAAALKKHLITNTPNDSTLELSSLIEKKRENKSIEREDEIHYKNIEGYTRTLPKNPDDYLVMMDEIDDAIKYFSDSNMYKRNKLDTLVQAIITNVAKNGLSDHGRRYGYLGRDVYSIKYKERLDIDRLVVFLENHPQYKDMVITIISEKLIQMEKAIVGRKKRIEDFVRPSRKERVAQAPYRSAPIISDQELSRDKGNLKQNLDEEQKNLTIYTTYLQKLQTQ